MSLWQEMIQASLAAHQQAISGCAQDCAEAIEASGLLLATALAEGHTILACGNGGSACDAMHFAGECVGRFVQDRRALPAIALSADPGILTAIGNDYGFDEVFARQVSAHGRAGGVLVAISTSGASPNVLRALERAGELGMSRIFLTSERCTAHDIAEQMIVVPSATTAHIQETHIWVLQLMIAIVEKKLF